MATEYSIDEKEALKRKLFSPKEIVYCPRCGKELQYKKVGNSSSARCPTKDCLYGSIRGL